jgi:hypothetical protein
MNAVQISARVMMLRDVPTGCCLSDVSQSQLAIQGNSRPRDEIRPVQVQRSARCHASDPARTRRFFRLPRFKIAQRFCRCRRCPLRRTHCPMAHCCATAILSRQHFFARPSRSLIRLLVELSDHRIVGRKRRHKNVGPQVPRARHCPDPRTDDAGRRRANQSVGVQPSGTEAGRRWL